MNGLIDDRLTDLALLVRVHETGGFTAASRTTGHPQATVSRRISQLEARLGVRLLNRTTRSVALTDAGQRVYELARAMLDQAEVISSVTQGLLAEPSGNLRVVAPVILGQAFVGDVMAEFMTLHRKVLVKLELTSRRIDLIEGGFDIAIQIGRTADSSLALTGLGTVRTGLFASPAYLHESASITEPSDLLHHDVFSIGLSLSKGVLRFQLGDRQEIVSPRKRMASNDVQPLLAAASSGIGIAVLPTFTGRKSVENGTLQEVLPAWRMPAVNVSALTPSTRGALPSVREFLVLMKRRLAEGLVEMS
jgi:DNA-binding transcriptional LysR family regulator